MISDIKLSQLIGLSANAHHLPHTTVYYSKKKYCINTQQSNAVGVLVITVNTAHLLPNGLYY